jgi:hypothetical protein
VRLHKKMKMKEMAGGGGELPSHPPPPPQLELLSQSAKQRLKRTLEQGLQPPEEEEEEVEDFEEILGPLEPSKKRKVVPPGSRLGILRWTRYSGIRIRSEYRTCIQGIRIGVQNSDRASNCEPTKLS